jgi:hypothetical protein
VQCELVSPEAVRDGKYVISFGYLINLILIAGHTCMSVHATFGNA